MHKTPAFQPAFDHNQINLIIFMTWFIEEEITNDQNNKPNWADFKRFKSVWL